MTRGTRRLAQISRRFFFQILLLLLIVALMSWLAANWFTNGTPLRVVVAAVVFVIWLAACLFACGVYLLQRDNYRIKQCANEVHQINHVYRDVLAELLSTDLEAETGTAEKLRERLLRIERDALASVCVKIANVFINLTGRKCVVTVKLLTNQPAENGKQFCFTWARSDKDIQRAGNIETQYWVRTGENTALDVALEKRPDGASYFYAADLKADCTYRNQRPNWEKVYRSAIVMPIQYRAEDGSSDILGFLSVDTMSANRLNDTYHVDFLAGFADQMYIFLSTIRLKHSSNLQTSSTPTPKSHLADRPPAA